MFCAFSDNIGVFGSLFSRCRAQLLLCPWQVARPIAAMAAPIAMAALKRSQLAFLDARYMILHDFTCEAPSSQPGRPWLRCDAGSDQHAVVLFTAFIRQLLCAGTDTPHHRSKASASGTTCFVSAKHQSSPAAIDSVLGVKMCQGSSASGTSHKIQASGASKPLTESHSKPLKFEETSDF